MNDIDQYKQDPSVLYSDRFFCKMQKGKEWQNYVGKKLYEDFNGYGKNTDGFMIDFGCGLGYYLEGAKNCGAVVLGYEYMYNIARKYIPPSIVNDIKCGNIMENIITEGSWKIAMTIEVAEHILPEKSDVMVDNLANGNHFDFILFSAAPEGQTGTGHINLHPQEFWEDKFKLYGYMRCDNILENKIKSYFDCSIQDFRDNVKRFNARYLNVIRRNIMLFAYKDQHV